jgi:tRNA threonylcarbamoyladenosine biosynthesis protein TsaE
MRMKLISNSLTGSEKETFELAKKLADGFAGGEIVLLIGELGTGKTVFAKGIAAGLDVPHPERVNSPSFTIIRHYQGRLHFYHLDLFRLDDPGEIFELGISELFRPPNVIAIEWAEKLGGLTPLPAIRVSISYHGDEKREILIEELPPTPYPAPADS